MSKIRFTNIFIVRETAEGNAMKVFYSEQEAMDWVKEQLNPEFYDIEIKLVMIPSEVK